MRALSFAAFRPILDRTMLLRAVRRVHDTVVFDRRKIALASMLSELVPDRCSLLDVGCGDGDLARMISEAKLGVTVSGVEVMARPRCAIACQVFNGIDIPVAPGSVDVCLFVDVLHHTHQPKELLLSARRATRRFVLIKDHLCENQLDFRLLQFMDWMGNRAHGVAIPYLYKSRSEWRNLFHEVGLRIVSWNENVRIHPFPLNLIFGRDLHMLTLLEKTS